MRANRRHMHGKRVRPSCTAAFKSVSESPLNSASAFKHDTGKEHDSYKGHDKVSTIQKIQTGLTAIELIPDVAPQAIVASSAAGVANTAISAARAGYHYLKGENEQGTSNLIDAGLSVAGSIPFYGYGATVAKGAKMADQMGQLRHLDDGVDIVAEKLGYDTKNEEGKGGFGRILSPEVEGGGVGKDSDAYASVSKMGSDLKNWWYGK